METQIRDQTRNAEGIEPAYTVEELRQFFPDADRIMEALDYEPDPLELRYERPLPVQLIGRYAKLAVRSALVERLDDGSWYAAIPGFPGVWAQADSEKGATEGLEAVVWDWTLLKIQDKDRDLPLVDTIDLNVL